MAVDKINWYPGHMKKASDRIIKEQKNIDLIIEILDARAIKSTQNYELKNFFKIPVISVVVKTDLANNLPLLPNNKYLFTSKYDLNFRKKVLNFVDKALYEKKQKSLKKKIIVPQFSILIMGMPNVGKTTFLNKLVNKNNLIVKNTPGVTKKISKIKITDNFFFYDNPGVLLKNIDNLELGYKLSLLNVIKQDVLPMLDVMEYAFYYWKEKNYKDMNMFFNNLIDNNFVDFLNEFCLQRHYFLKSKVLDISRGADELFNLFVNGKVGKINYDY